MAKNFDLIVFDWDGTLMDSTAHIAHSIQLASAELGLPVPDRATANHVIGLGLTEALACACPELTPDRYPAMIDAYRRHYFGRDETLELFDGVREGLAALARTGVILAVATGKSRRGLDRALEATGIAPCFAASRTVDECASKPDPEMLHQLSALFDIAPERTLMVGDTTHDLQMANNAGARGAGVCYGAHPREALLDCQPLGLFDSFDEFCTWLRNHLS
ncbi:HAD-IA family hydrolase [Paludibacterium yongneupense]|uniref:HAD-IA family hydrolase n=1 Tax=Paludibacterium yongneupense TaxID=400061 RepID=UPI00041BF16F|nr:HAD-IA family hydrolase [Paludibacterium yongneupense]